MHTLSDNKSTRIMLPRSFLLAKTSSAERFNNFFPLEIVSNEYAPDYSSSAIDYVGFHCRYLLYSWIDGDEQNCDKYIRWIKHY